MKDYYVYIMANVSKTIYIWVTNDIQRRVYEHKNWLNEWFTKKYNCHKLVWFERFWDVNQVIECEKKLKKFRRERKVKLIQEKNCMWKDLSLEN